MTQLEQLLTRKYGGVMKNPTPYEAWQKIQQLPKYERYQEANKLFRISIWTYASWEKKDQQEVAK